MAAIFDKLGIRFQYPENWTLDESEALAGDQAVTVFSPGGRLLVGHYSPGGDGARKAGGRRR